MAGRGDDLWKPFKVNKWSNTLHLYAAMCDTSMIPIGHIFNAILQAMEYRKKLWSYIRRFMRLICWIHTGFEGLNYLYKPSKCQQTNNMSQWTPHPPRSLFFFLLFFFLPSFPFRSRLWRWPLAPLVWWDLKVFFWDWDYLLGIRWKLFCLEIRQWPIESLNKQNTIITFLNLATVSTRG